MVKLAQEDRTEHLDGLQEGIDSLRFQKVLINSVSLLNRPYNIDSYLTRACHMT